MSLYEEIKTVFPELEENKEAFITMQIVLKNDLDGTGDYIAKWDYSKPLPDKLKSFLRK